MQEKEQRVAVKQKEQPEGMSVVMNHHGMSVVMGHGMKVFMRKGHEPAVTQWS